MRASTALLHRINRYLRHEHEALWWFQRGRFEEMEHEARVMEALKREGLV